MDDLDRAGLGWTVVLRRQPIRIVAGRAEGGYTDVYELVCCECGDDPDLDYREVPAGLRQIRGPYPFAAGIAAYERHVQQYHQPRKQPRPRLRGAITARITRPDDSRPETGLASKRP